MKKAILLLSIFILMSCSKDDDLCMDNSELITLEDVRYCSQDNIVFINDEWIMSVDLNTLSDPLTWESANDILGVRHDTQAGGLILKSNTYDFHEVIIQALNHTVTYQGSIARVYIPQMQTYLNATDTFYMKITFKNR